MLVTKHRFLKMQTVKFEVVDKGEYKYLRLARNSNGSVMGII